MAGEFCPHTSSMIKFCKEIENKKREGLGRTVSQNPAVIQTEMGSSLPVDVRILRGSQPCKTCGSSAEQQLWAHTVLAPDAIEVLKEKAEEKPACQCIKPSRRQPGEGKGLTQG